MNLEILKIGELAGALLAIIGLGVWAVTNIKRAVRAASEPIKELQDKISKNNAAARAALRYSITRAHRQYMKEGVIGPYSLQSIHDIHDQYIALGGNGFVEKLVKDLHSLPVESHQKED